MPETIKRRESIFYAILAGIAGLVIGVLLFATGSNLYGDIKLSNKKDLVCELLNARTDTLKNDVSVWESLKNAVIKSHPGKPGTAYVMPDSAKDYLKKMLAAEAAIRNTRHEQQMLDHANTDGNLAYIMLFITLDRHVMAGALGEEGWTSGIKNIPVTLTDTCKAIRNYPLVLKKDLVLKIDHQDRIDFFSQYPQFGLWMVFTLVQLVLWGMVCPMLFSEIQILGGDQNSGHKLDLKRLARYVFFSWLLTGLFLLIIYVWLIDRPIVPDNFFLDHYSIRITVFGLIGYSVASFCFGIYVTTARELDDINKTVTADAAAATTDLNNSYTALKSLFDNSFYCSAMILSLCVLWTGILISGIDSTEAFRYYFLLTGSNLIPNDFPYLIGLLNTLLLLIFYVPVKLKFGSLEPVATPGAIPVVAGSATPTSIFSTLSGALGTLVLTASPLLASLVTSLFKLLIGS